MYRDWFVVVLFMLIFGSFWALTIIPLLIWDAWTPFIGAGIGFVMATVISVLITVLEDP